MKPTVLIVPLYAMFMTFSILSLFFGQTGVVALERLEDRNRTLARNLDDLEIKHNDLMARFSTLRSDPEALVIESRSIGLYRNSDYIVRFNRIDSSPLIPDAGGVLNLSPVRKYDETILRVVSAGVGLIALIAIFLTRKVFRARQAN